MQVLASLRRLARPGVGQAVVAVIALLAMGSVTSAWFAVLPTGDVEGLDPDEAAAVGVSLLVGGVGAILSWTVVSTFQRAATIVLAARAEHSVSAAVRRAGRRAGALVLLGAVVGVIEITALFPSIACPALFLATELDGMQILFAFAMLFWLVTRSYTGLAVACVVLEDLSALRALARSATTLRGHRVAALTTRMVLLPIAGIAIALARIEGWTAWSPLHPTVFVVPLVVMVDGYIEAAWHEHLRPAVDREQVAEVFR